MPDEDDTLAELGWAWRNRKRIVRALKVVAGWFTKAQKPILVLGAGGTGKTTAGLILAGKFDYLLDAPESYQESIGVEKMALKDDQKLELMILPGQQHRRSATWNDPFRSLAQGEFRGVLLLSAYGYHSLGLMTYKQHKLFRGRDDEFLRDYLSDRRNEELSVIRELTPHVLMNRHPMWLLNLVTKADLWWPSRAEVHEHYTTGPYGAEISKLVSQKAPELFRHEICFGSLIISNFVTGNKELLQQNTAGYDHKLHAESLRRILETADALRTWELK